MTLSPRDVFEQAAEVIRGADALLIGAGAGMGVDSGLPDFRGAEGFWTAYPAFARLGIDFMQMANPAAFKRDPSLAWGFYGHRLELYRQTTPHPGFQILTRWAQEMSHGAFVYTSNIDGHFQKSGFDAERVVECHGSLNHLQCTQPCSDAIWSANDLALEVNPTDMRAEGDLPLCPRCGALARPNVLMFGDWNWVNNRSEAQEQRFSNWCGRAGFQRLAILECGAGNTVPTVRLLCERATDLLAGSLVRINPRDCDVPEGQIALPVAALASLEELDELLDGA